MIDREARDRYAQLLRQFAAGRLSNRVYEQKFDEISGSFDPAIWGVYQEMWYSYCDFRKHKLRGRDALGRDSHRCVARMVMFLYSDREFEWRQPGLWHVLINLMTFGVWKKLRPDPRPTGEAAVWPFFREPDYVDERTSPRLLTGGSAREPRVSI